MNFVVECNHAAFKYYISYRMPMWSTVRTQVTESIDHLVEKWMIDKAFADILQILVMEFNHLPHKSLCRNNSDPEVSLSCCIHHINLKIPQLYQLPLREAWCALCIFRDMQNIETCTRITFQSRAKSWELCPPWFGPALAINNLRQTICKFPDAWYTD